MVQIVSESIDPQQSYQRLQPRSAGSVLLHYAVVKADAGTGRTSCAVDYRPEAGAQAELEQIAAALKSRWPLEEVLLQRRSGRLEVGEIISLVGVAAAASADAFAACQMGLELLKKMQTVRKQEVFV
jgi:molybdopterin synthase catalytic subunit